MSMSCRRLCSRSHAFTYSLSEARSEQVRGGKVVELDQWTNRDDPVGSCLPLGIPRQGPPARIFHTENDISMIYRGGVDGAGGYAEFRMISLDGKPHDPRRAAQYTYMGYTVGRWEGDTLVLDSIGFTDETWLGRGGWFHSDQMRVVERFTRTGNQMLYEVTVEDPTVYTRPWTAQVEMKKKMMTWLA